MSEPESAKGLQIGLFKKTTVFSEKVLTICLAIDFIALCNRPKNQQFNTIHRKNVIKVLWEQICINYCYYCKVLFNPHEIKLK